MKTRQDNDVIDHVGVFYFGNDTKLSWPIESGDEYDENHIRQVVTDHTDAVYVENKIELSWLIGSGTICDKNQIGQWHDISYRSGIGKIKIEMLGHIWPWVVNDEN